MRSSVAMSLAAGAMAVLAGCQQDAVDPSQRVADLLATVPADTAYLAAATEHLPDDVFDHYMDVFAPRLAELLEETQASTLAEKTGESENVAALLGELADYFRNRDEIQQYRYVIYAVDLFPVLRIELDDPDATLADLRNLHQQLTQAPESLPAFADQVFQIHLSEGHLNLNYGIVDRYLMASVLPSEGAEALRDQIYSNEAPAAPYDQQAIEQLHQQHGYQGYNYGFVDTLALVDQLMAEHSLMNDWFRLHEPAAERMQSDAVCQQESRDLAALAPYMSWGITALTDERITTRTFVELRDDIATGLSTIPSQLGGTGSDPGGAMAMALSFRVGAMRDFIMQQAGNVRAAPFQCEHLQSLNDSAEQILAQAGTVMPPFVGQLRGLKLRIDDFMTMTTEQRPTGGMVLFVENAQLLLSMGQMMMPQLASLDIKPDGEPVRIDEAVSAMAAGMVPDGAIYAALTEQSIAVSSGSEEPTTVTELMAEPGNGDGAMFSLWLDYALLLKQQQQMVDQTLEEAMGDYAERQADTEHEIPDPEKVRRLMNAMYRLYEPLSRVGTVAMPREGGMVVEQTIDLVNP
ncbi:MAG: hypothetical protein Tsb002_07110 [Wenzhouxiangellaceae bacterium]